MPNLPTIDQAPMLVLLHLAAAVAALVLGAIVLFRRKGNGPHRLLGRIWVMLMLYVAIGSFWIQGRDRLSLIHLLSVVIIVNIGYALWAIRTRRLQAHRFSMLYSYVGLWVAGAFTLLPHRMLGKLFFG